MNELAIPDRNVDGLDAVNRALQITIGSNDEYLAADAFCVGLKDLEKQVGETFDVHINAAYKAHKDLLAKKNKFVEPISEARNIVKAKLDRWQRQQETVRLEQERRLQEAARKAAEERAIAEALEAEKAGDKAQAEAIIAAPVIAPTISLERTVPKAKTILREHWTFRISSESAIPREYLVPDQVKIGQVVRALKEATNIPGVQVISERI